MAQTERVGLKMRIAIGADHGGFLLKQKLIKFLESKGHTVADMGTHTDESCDYPVFAEHVARPVASGQFDRGILICKTGIGMSMAANKIKGVRAALCRDTKDARTSRQHNDANVICLAANRTSFLAARDILNIWLNTEFEAGRHKRRTEQMERLS